MIVAKLTGSRCKCTACGQLFNSVSTFDQHRVGGWENRGANRRCLTVAEMLTKGWQLNAGGFWIRRSRLHATRRSGDRALPGTTGAGLNEPPETELASAHAMLDGGRILTIKEGRRRFIPGSEIVRRSRLPDGTVG